MSVMGRILAGAALMAVLLAVGCSSGDSPSEITGLYCHMDSGADSN